MRTEPKFLVRMLVVSVAAAPAIFSQYCQNLEKLSSPVAIVTIAEPVTAGIFAPAVGSRAITQLPLFCRAAVTLKPTSDSEIHAEIWLPTTTWNNKLLAVGSGGWGGSIAYEGMAEGLRRGYVTAATDDGHTGSSAAFIAGHPEKFIDFAYRAEHEMTVAAKMLIKALYGHP